MKILAIESSCDDTSVALLNITDKKIEILAEHTASQIDIHKKYGGVIPELAGRAHAENIIPLIEDILNVKCKKQDTSVKYKNKPDVIAVTSGPGLMTGLLVGIEAAKTLSYLWNVPIVRMNHIEGHIYSTQITDHRLPITDQLHFPALCLIASGGHTELILMKDHGKYELIGKTRDDAAGEAFDKVAKLIGLDYPGGPKISKLAEVGDPTAIKFPRPMLGENNFDFSFSGLKTAALYWLQKNAKQKSLIFNLKSSIKNDFCASFEQAIIDVLVDKTIKASQKYKPKTIIIGGGVSANQKLRQTLPASTTLYPLPKYSMDNATMIAVASYHHAKKKDFTPWNKLEADPNWKIYE